MRGDDRSSEIHIPACCPVLLAVCNSTAGYALAVSLSRCLLSRNATLRTHFCICPCSIPVAPAGKTVSRKARHLIPVCIPSLFSQRNSCGTPISLVHYFQLMIYVFREAFIFSSTVVDCLCDDLLCVCGTVMLPAVSASGSMSAIFSMWTNVGLER